MQDQDVSLDRPKEPLVRGAAFFVSIDEGLPLDLRPRISVVVPTCGRPALLKRCLRALARQRLERHAFEILVVDDRPSDATRGTVEEFAATHPQGPLVRYLASTGPHGPAAARNRGWQHTRADIIAFTDDDTEPDPGWLANGMIPFATGADAVCGRIVMPISAVPTDYERDARHLEHAEFVTANCLCRKTVLEQLGGFDERFRLAWREDSDLHFRLLRSRARLVYAPDTVVVHPVRPAPWGVSLRQQRKVVFDALLFKKHPELYRRHIRAAPRWDYYATVAALIAVLIGASFDVPTLAGDGAVAWFALTTVFCLRRLRGTSKSFAHVVEMILTSALIPPVAVFWRLVGALRFRVMFV